MGLSLMTCSPLLINDDVLTTRYFPMMSPSDYSQHLHLLPTRTSGSADTVNDILHCGNAALVTGYADLHTGSATQHLGNLFVARGSRNLNQAAPCIVGERPIRPQVQ